MHRAMWGNMAQLSHFHLYIAVKGRFPCTGACGSVNCLANCTAPRGTESERIGSVHNPMDAEATQGRLLSAEEETGAIDIPGGT